MLSIPAYYFPSSVCLLDDDKSFLNNITAYLDQKYVYVLTTSVQDAIRILNSQKALAEETQEFKNEELNNQEKYLLEINYSKFYQIIFDVNRFNNVNTAIFDFNMPEVNGIDFARQLKNSIVKKIMLTGEADSKIAISAFNKGLINKFLTKDIEMPDLNTYIAELQHQFFVDITQNSVNNIIKHSPYWIDTQFINLVNQLIISNNIVEYYVISASGSLLMLDEEGKYYFLVVLSDPEIDYYAKIALGNDAPYDISKSLEEREKVPLFLTNEDKNKTIDQWGSNLFTSKKLSLKHGIIHYAFVENYIHPAIEINKVRSFKEYKAKRGTRFSFYAS